MGGRQGEGKGNTGVSSSSKDVPGLEVIQHAENQEFVNYVYSSENYCLADLAV